MQYAETDLVVTGRRVADPRRAVIINRVSADEAGWELLNSEVRRTRKVTHGRTKRVSVRWAS